LVKIEGFERKFPFLTKTGRVPPGPKIAIFCKFCKILQNFDQNFDQKNDQKIDQNFRVSQAAPRRKFRPPGARADFCKIEVFERKFPFFEKSEKMRNLEFFQKLHFLQKIFTDENLDF